MMIDVAQCNRLKFEVNSKNVKREVSYEVFSTKKNSIPYIY